MTRWSRLRFLHTDFCPVTKGFLPGDQRARVAQASLLASSQTDCSLRDGLKEDVRASKRLDPPPHISASEERRHRKLQGSPDNTIWHASWSSSSATSTQSALSNASAHRLHSAKRFYARASQVATISVAPAGGERAG
jgi:hypothetical protein